MGASIHPEAFRCSTFAEAGRAQLRSWSGWASVSRLAWKGCSPRVLYRYNIALDRVVDLADDEVRAQAGLGLDVLTGPDWTACQELGSTLHTLGAQGINSPSATGVGDVLAVFVQHIGLGRLEPELTEEWHSVDDVK